MGGFADLKRGQPKHGHNNKMNTHSHTIALSNMLDFVVIIST